MFCNIPLDNWAYDWLLVLPYSIFINRRYICNILSYKLIIILLYKLNIFNLYRNFPQIVSC